MVHYPLFRNIPVEAFCEYEKKNMVTGYVVVPVMTIEMVTGLWLLFQEFSLLYLTNTILLGIIWLSTAIYQGPLHNQLSKEPSPALMLRLVKTNWIRTIAWTARALLLLYVLGESL